MSFFFFKSLGLEKRCNACPADTKTQILCLELTLKQCGPGEMTWQVGVLVAEPNPLNSVCGITQYTLRTVSHSCLLTPSLTPWQT